MIQISERAAQCVGSNAVVEKYNGEVRIIWSDGLVQTNYRRLDAGDVRKIPSVEEAVAYLLENTRKETFAVLT